MQGACDAQSAFGSLADLRLPPQHEYRVQRHDGVWRWHVSQGAPIWEDGEIVRWVNVITDIQVCPASRLNDACDSTRVNEPIFTKL